MKRKCFVECAFCGKKIRVKEKVTEVLEKNWFEIIIKDKDENELLGGYICDSCFSLLLESSPETSKICSIIKDKKEKKKISKSD